MELRLTAGLSIASLALRAGLAPNTVRAAERGLRPQIRSQFAIASALGVSVLELWPIEVQQLGMARPRAVDRAIGTPGR
jgi:lambda repressor-like predicted transcriptional regulator